MVSEKAYYQYKRNTDCVFDFHLQTAVANILTLEIALPKPFDKYYKMLFSYLRIAFNIKLKAHELEIQNLDDKKYRYIKKGAL